MESLAARISALMSAGSTPIKRRKRWRYTPRVTLSSNDSRQLPELVNSTSIDSIKRTIARPCAMTRCLISSGVRFVAIAVIVLTCRVSATLTHFIRLLKSSITGDRKLRRYHNLRL